MNEQMSGLVQTLRDEAYKQHCPHSRPEHKIRAATGGCNPQDVSDDGHTHAPNPQSIHPKIVIMRTERHRANLLPSCSNLQLPSPRMED